MAATPAGLRRLWRAVVSARPRRVAELTELDAAIRRPLPLSTRVGVVGVAGGSGCSTAAGLVAATLAHRRSTRVLAVNASASRRSLLWHAGQTAAATSTPLQDAARAAAGDAASALEGLATAPGGLHCLDLLGPAAPGGAASDDTRWWDAVAPASRFFDFVVTDWGVRDTAGLGHVVASSSVLCVVTTPDREGLQRAVELAAATDAAGTPCVVAVMPARGRVQRGAREAVRMLPVRSVTFVVDTAHGAARPLPASHLRAATTLATLRLAALLVDVARARRPVSPTLAVGAP